MRVPCTQTLVSEHHPPVNRTSLLGEVGDSRTGNKKHKISLEYLVVLKRERKKRMRYVKNATAISLKEFPITKTEQFEQ